MRDDDTIVALSSGVPPSGVAVLRISGPRAASLLKALAGELPEPRRLVLRRVRWRGAEIDRGLVAWFPAPHSFTGEDCAELQVHGSPAVVRALLRRMTDESGVRLAEAGEFTRRAFENGRLDLTEIEGLGDLIEAETESQRSQALARMSGGLSEVVGRWRMVLLDLRSEIEARLDFADEGDVGLELPGTWLEGLEKLQSDIAAALEDAERGRIVRQGLRVVLAGPPNVGKSSLLNALSKSDVAIVTEEAGTTRDVREVPVDLGGQLVILTDTAGVRETESLAEAEGVRRAKRAMEDSDLVLWLSSPDVPNTLPPLAPRVWEVASKADLGMAAESRAIAVSVVDRQGLDELLERLKEFASEGRSDTPALVSRERDRAALQQSLSALGEARGLVGRPELAAEALRQASDSLARLVGEMDAEAVLDRLFLSFCIGK